MGTGFVYEFLISMSPMIESMRECWVNSSVTFMEFLDVDSYKVSWMALISNVESLVLHLLNYMCNCIITIAKEHSVIDVHGENDVILIKHALINKLLCKSNFM